MTVIGNPRGRCNKHRIVGRMRVNSPILSAIAGGAAGAVAFKMMSKNPRRKRVRSPWAVCHAVGLKRGTAKFERCVKKVKVKGNPKEKELNYIVFGWSRDPNIGRAQLAGYDGTLRFRNRADAIKLAKAQLKGVYDRVWVESVVYHKDTGWTPFDIVFDERKSGNPSSIRRRHRSNRRRRVIGRSRTERKLTSRQARKIISNPGHRRKVTMSLDQFARHLQKMGNKELIADFRKKISDYKKWTHGSLPARVTVEKVDAPGMKGVWLTTDLGKEPESRYVMPSGSKRKGAWKHKWETMPELKGDAGTKVIITKLRGSSSISDFLHK